jgi:hypothetical protein
MMGGAAVLDIEELSGSRIGLAPIYPVIFHTEFEEVGAG